MKLQQLKRLTQVWQERLKLLDWDITVCWATVEQVEHEQKWAWVDFWRDEKRAKLTFTRPEHYGFVPEEQKRSADPEVFIIHELMHLHFTPFNTENGSAEDMAEENIVNLVSRLLIAIDRKEDEITGRKLSRKASFNPPSRERKKKEEKVEVLQTTVQ